MTRSVLAALVVLLIAAAPSGAGGVHAAQDPVLGSYIVVLKPDSARSATAAPSARPLVAAVAQELSRAHGGAVTSVYQYALKGFAARLSADQAEALTNDPRVAYVEQDQVFHTLATQTPATWGLDRIDQRDLPLNNTYNYNQTRAGRPRLHHRHRHPRHPSGVHRQDRERLHRGERRERHERLQRPRHACGRHDRRHDVRRCQAGHAPRRARARAARARARTRASSPASTGSPRTTSSPPSPT